MGVGYHLHCQGCGMDRHVLLGQGDDAFYEFNEEALFYCEECLDVQVVTVPVSSEDIAVMLEGGFATPWSKLTHGDTPQERRANAEAELVKIMAGYYDHPECPRCLGTHVRRLTVPADTCPRCGEALNMVKEMLWE